MMSETVLHVSKIRNGTVIDHIMGGHALDKSAREGAPDRSSPSNLKNFMCVGLKSKPTAHV